MPDDTPTTARTLPILGNCVATRRPCFPAGCSGPIGCLCICHMDDDQGMPDDTTTRAACGLRDGGQALDVFRTHSLKVIPPYLDALKDGGKTFEVRKNDRGYQRGDLLIVNEWHPAHMDRESPDCHACRNLYWSGHYSGRKVVRWVTFVYSGDPRFGGLEPGHVVLGLGEDDYTRTTEAL